jgi:DNA-3-methyladenine glycosylase I
MRAEPLRCPWCGQDPLYVAYHDCEWGVPSFDDRHLFEMLILEGAQAGLSWITILRKRERYREVYEQFDPARVAAFDDDRQATLLADPGIVRNRLKIAAARDNARAALEIQAQHGSLAAFLWTFVDGRPLQNRLRSLSEAPARTEVSDRMSRELKRRGFRFVGSTICYAFMQAVGMVNDHLVDCHRHDPVAALAP